MTDDLLEPIDRQLGRLIRRTALRSLPGDDAELLAGAAMQVSAARRSGHACVPLELLGGAGGAGGVDAVAAVLAAAGPALCGSGEVPAPLVLDGERLYLYRYWKAERRLGAAMRRLLDAPPSAVPPAADALFTRLFAAPTGGATDWQAVAARAALTRRLTVITGGPGTGKTTTVARILALLLTAEPRSRIALAAPTGKAAARLRDSVEHEVSRLELPPALAARIPTQGRTIHRLLGYRPWDDRFTYDRARPLTEDVIVVDEASMVDLLLMDALFDAARPDARIVLLGDHGQLASVETGAVLGDFCRLALAGAAPLRNSVVELQRSYRFEAHPGIGAVAAAIRAGDGAGAVAQLRSPAHTEVALHEYPVPPAGLVELIAPELDAFLAATDPADALARLGAFRILCGTYAGDWGVHAVTSLVEARLRRLGRDADGSHYDHQPVLITSNDYGTQLFNGDVGVVLESSSGRRVWFADGAGGVRAVAPARLPAHAPAWAMTVHKAQGSEFDRVVVVLPNAESRVLSRELLYTAVTRARSRVDVVGDEATIVAAAARVTERRSGLAAALGLA